ncbi:MAG: DAK2 domain-containing protein [Tissierellia bacterium]|nr:DAK2 domain-containing protein [Tissierellia bacterium]
MNHIDKDMLVRLLESGTNYLIEHKNEVNELNVFPVPDGDTGTNMSMTVQSALKQVKENKATSAAEVAQLASRGALMGARGNSGVILSQLFRGFSEGIKGKEKLNSEDLARGFKQASETTYSAVMKPTEGTILTVARELSEFAMKSYKDHKDLEDFFEGVLGAAKKSLDNTPNLLPVLREAGVVDAGGMGLVKILEGGFLALKGQDVKILDGLGEKKVARQAKREAISTDDIKFGYCTEFIVITQEDHVAELKKDLTPLGDSMLVVGDKELIKVHIHTNNPGAALEYGVSYGYLKDIKIDNMRIQHEEVLFSQEELASSKAEASPKKEDKPHKKYGLLAVCTGDGLSNLFKDLAVDYVVTGGQTMNPSTEDLLQGIKEIPADHIFLLPNNGNIILAAQQTVNLAEAGVHVIPTRSVPEGIAACLAFNSELDLEDNIDRMEEAAQAIVSAEVTYAVKDTGINGKTIKKGDIMGICGKEILSSGADINQVTYDLVEKLAGEDHSLISLYYGEGRTQEEAEALQVQLEARFEDFDVEVIYGGQPLYYYLVSIE